MKPLEVEFINQINKFSKAWVADLYCLLNYSTIEADELKNLELDLKRYPSANSLDFFTSLEKNEELKLPSSKLPLGKYAEQLFQIYFAESNDFELLESNLQIFRDGITVGEIDFLLKERLSGDYVHLEVATKYYLKVNFQDQLVFLGPSTKDNLTNKVKKLETVQSKQTIKYKDLLPKEYAGIEFDRRIHLSGALFLPFKEWKELKEKNVLSFGWWLGIEEISLLDGESQFMIISNKKEWIFPYREKLKMDAERLVEVTTLLLQSRNEVMIVRCLNNKFIDRGFLMRKNWPNE